MLQNEGGRRRPLEHQFGRQAQAMLDENNNLEAEYC